MPRYTPVEPSRLRFRRKRISVEQNSMKQENIENRVRNATHSRGNRSFQSDLLERRDICTDCPQVIHSSIIPAENDFILFELDSSEERIRLHLEKGIKNGNEVEISLY